MPDYSKLELRTARDEAGMTRLQATTPLAVSESTLKRWEDPAKEGMPRALDVSRMEDVYGSVGLWWRWCRIHDEAFRDRMPDLPDLDFKGAMMALFAEMEDIKSMQAELFKDAADGRINDMELLKKACKEVGDVVAHSYLLYGHLQKLKRGG